VDIPTSLHTATQRENSGSDMNDVLNPCYILYCDSMKRQTGNVKKLFML
jgi:hypothetical protein